MYESYWKLAHKPFETTNDTRFYYPSESHQGALLKLRYAVENRRGAALLTGQAGLGKTLLIQALSSQLEPTFSPCVHVVFPQMPADQLLALIASEVSGQGEAAPATVQQSVQRLQKALQDNVEAGRHAVLIIDEAQVLHSPQTLETVRLLLNFEFEAKTTMTVLLVGQPALLPVLDRTPELDERLAVKCMLRRFTPEETMGYIVHRLKAAEGDPNIFEEAALEAVHRHAHGIPRRINRLCDLALLIGFAEERERIAAAQIESISDELVMVAPE